jgi:hypothetical protein
MSDLFNLASNDPAPSWELPGLIHAGSESQVVMVEGPVCRYISELFADEEVRYLLEGHAGNYL